MTEQSNTRKTIRIVLLIAALILLTGAGFRTYKVYEPEEDEFGIFVFYRVSEKDIVVDSTFQGVDRLNGKLVTTYDRLAESGAKRPCPT